MSARGCRGPLLAILVGALLAAAGCTGDGRSGPPEGGGTAPARADAALLALGELLDADGALPVEQAQRIVAGVVHPLPGVEPWTPADAADPTADAASQTAETASPTAGAVGPTADAAGLAGPALRTVVAAAPRLSPPVARAVTAIVEPSPEERELVLAPGQALARRGAGGDVPSRVPSDGELIETVAGIVAQIEERSGHELRLPVRVRTVADARTGGDAVMTPVIDAAGSARACRIALPRGLFGNDAASITSTIAHEVWHCFQYDAAPARRLLDAPLWIIEGQAEWVGEEFSGGSASSASRWDTWLLQPAQALARRSYDAIGLYAVAQAAGADPWRTSLPMLGRRGAGAVETLFARPAPEAVRRVATSLVRSPELGEVWESTGPGITGSRGSAQLTVPVGEPVEARLTAPAFGVLPMRISASGGAGGDVLRVGIEGGAAGAVAMPGAGTVDLAPGGTALFCLVEGGCTCEDGTTPAGVAQAKAGEGAAAVGTTAAGEVVVMAELVTVEQACERPSLVGEWVTDVSQVMRTLSAQYGMMPSCTGPWVVTFAPDGGWTAGYDATCRVSDVAAEATARFTGTYVDTGRTFTVSDVRGEGSMTVRGVAMPLPGVDGFRSALGNTADYTITGDTLTYSFAAPDGTKPTIVLTRRS